jgi:hypothetical protein
LIAIADAVAVALVAAALWTLFSGSSRWILFGAPVSLTFVHAAFAAALVVTARHAIRHQPSLLERVRGWFRRVSEADDLRIAAAAFATRPLVLLVGFLAVVAIGVNPDAEGPFATTPAGTAASRSRATTARSGPTASATARSSPPTRC